MMSGMMGSVMQGMAFGTGSAIAHRAVGAAAGAMSGDGDSESASDNATANTSAGAEANQQPQSCDVDTNKFYECLDEKGGNISECQFFFDMMQQCQKESEQRSQFS